jgi:hypothetical protein
MSQAMAHLVQGRLAWHMLDVRGAGLLRRRHPVKQRQLA